MTTIKNLVKQVLMSIVTAVILGFSFSSCSDEMTEFENMNPLFNQVVGTWYDEYGANGVLGEGEDAISYDKVVRVAYFESDGTGNWYHYYLIGDEPIKADAGHFECGFNYTVDGSGLVSIHDSDLSDSGDHARDWSLQSVDGRLIGEEGQDVFDMELATSEQQEYARRLFRAINGGAEGSGINVNDFVVHYNKTCVARPFTYKDWRDHEAIFVNTCGNNKIDVDTPEGTQELWGFSLVNLPNSKDVGENANLPAGVWEEVWEKGSDWELAFNTCGYDRLEHGSYLGFYNKYKGIVRVFAYIDGAANSAASEHLWAIQMDDELAQHSAFRYGLPIDRTLKDKKAIKQGGSEMAQVTTPWASSSAIDGVQQPTKGWWCFDIDLSIYRGSGVKRISDYFGSSKDLLKLRCLGFTEQKEHLTSTLRGQASGTIDLEKTSVSSSSGVFGSVEDLLGKANGLKELYDLGTKLMNPNPLESIGTGIELAKKGCDLFGIDYGQQTTGKDGYKGEISMDLTAEIDTEGIISGSIAVNGNASPSLTGNSFLVKSDNCQTLGEGVWNIKSAPKVYVVNDVRVDWRRQDMDDKDDPMNYNSMAYYWIYSPFGGAANIYPYNKMFNAPTKPFQGKICVFDPSSVEVELNPNIFPAGTNYKVSAVCGVRKGMKIGSTESYRKAQGLQGSEFKIACDRYNSHISDRPVTEAGFDGFYGFNSRNIPNGYKTGMKFEEETYNGRQFGLFGRGDSDFLVEPMALVGGKDKDDWTYYSLPAYEVTVTVTVEHNGRTYVYSRTYLPEYEGCKASDLEKVYNKAVSADRTHYAELYDCQVNRFQEVRAWIARTPICDGSIRTKWTTFDLIDNKGWTKEEESGYALIDGNPETCWYSSKNSRCGKQINRTVTPGSDAYCSWVAWHTFFNNVPKSFTLTCGKYTNKIPQKVKLFAKENANDEWTQIYFEDYVNHRLQPKKGATVTCILNNNKPYKYYRFECSGNSIDYSFAELKMNY